MLKTNRLGATVSKDLSETVTVSLAGQVFLVQTLPVQGSGAQAAETRLILATPALTWKLSQWWTLDASYTYANRNTDVTHDMSHGSSAFLKLTYIIPKLSFSR